MAEGGLEGHVRTTGASSCGDSRANKHAERTAPMLEVLVEWKMEREWSKRLSQINNHLDPLKHVRNGWGTPDDPSDN
jgi:hypothetical protein